RIDSILIEQLVRRGQQALARRQPCRYAGRPCAAGGDRGRRFQTHGVDYTRQVCTLPYRQVCLVLERSPMSHPSAATLTSRAASAPRQLSPTAAFVLLASLTVSFLAGSSAPTPLYPVYMATWGLTPLTITEIFGIYALAVLLSLLLAGRLSDHVGRRPV